MVGNCALHLCITNIRVGWENRQHFATPSLVSLQNDVWENEHKNYIQLYPDLGSHTAQPIRSTTKIWVVSHNQYGISALISQRSFCGETSGGIVKCQLFSQAIIRAVTKFKLARKWRSHREFQKFLVLSVYLVSIKVTRTNICSDIKANSQPPALSPWWWQPWIILVLCPTVLQVKYKLFWILSWAL